MLAQEIIRIKRDGGTLQRAHIDAFVAGLVDGTWSEGQAAALAMAVFLKGLSKDETVALTLAMTHSGEVLDWAGAALHGPVLDKHSTGGVGDKVSLMLAPILAACIHRRVGPAGCVQPRVQRHWHVRRAARWG